MLVSALHAFASRGELNQLVEPEVDPESPDDNWHTWLSAEENARLVFCVHSKPLIVHQRVPLPSLILL